MISAEELKIVQDQIAQMQEESADLTSQIETERARSAQIHLIKSQIESSREELASMTQQFEKREEKQKRKIHSALQARTPMRAISFPSLNPLNLFKTGEKKDDDIDAVAARLESETAKLAEMDAKIEQLYEKLEKAATQDQEVTVYIDQVKKFIAKYEVIQPQIETCLGYEMMVQDLVARLDHLKGVRSAQKGRRYRLKNWLAQTEMIRDNSERTLEDMGHEYDELEKNLLKHENEYAEAQAKLTEVMSQCSEMMLMVANQIEENEKMKKQGDEDGEREQQECEKARQSIGDIEKATAGIRAEIGGYGLTKKRLLKKKLDLIDQLKKRVKVEKENRSVIDVNSPAVVELTRQVNDQMLEKEAVEMELKKHEERLKWLQAEDQKKDLLIEECTRLVPVRAGEVLTEDRAWQDFVGFVDDTQVQNQCYFDDMQTIGNELEGLEGENQSLRSILSSME